MAWTESDIIFTEYNNNCVVGSESFCLAALLVLFMTWAFAFAAANERIAFKSEVKRSFQSICRSLSLSISGPACRCVTSFDCLSAAMEPAIASISDTHSFTLLWLYGLDLCFIFSAAFGRQHEPFLVSNAA